MSEPLVRIPRRSLGNVVEVLREYDVAGWPLEALGGREPHILDVGANVGIFSLFAAQLFAYRCQIEAFEPHPETFGLLRQNLDNVPQTSVYHCAVVGEEVPGELHDAGAGRLKRRATLYDGKFNRLCASLYQLGWQSTKGVSVPLLSASKLPPCDVFKVDTEGAEVGIVRAYQHGERVRFALCEWHRTEDRQPLHEVFTAWGLKLQGIVWGANSCGVMRWVRQSGESK